MIPGPFLPLAAGEWSQLMVMILAGTSLGVLGLVILATRWRRPDLDPEHVMHIIPQLSSLGGTRGHSVVVSDPDALDDADTIQQLRGLFTGDGGPEGPTVSSASREVLHEIRGELAARTPDVATVPVRATQEAALIALFGSITILPIAWWREATQPAGDFALPTLTEVAAWAASGWNLGVDAAMAFPFSDVFFSLALTFGILGADAIWTTWFLPPVVLVSLAALYLWLDRRVDADRPLSGPSVGGWTRRILTLAVVVWVVGAGLATLGAILPYRLLVGAGLALLVAVVAVQAFGVDWTRSWAVILAVVFPLGLVHSAAALILALLVGGVLAGVWIRRALVRWRRTAVRDGRDALALDVTHSVTVTTAAFAAPLLLAYAVAAFYTRKAFTVAEIVVSAPPSTAYAVLILAVVLALAVVVVFAGRFRDVRRGFRRAMSVQAVRGVLYARAMPFMVMVLAGVLVAAFGFGLVATVAGMLAVGFITRGLVAGYNYASYRYATRPSRDESASRVVVSGRRVRDANDGVLYVADVNGHRTAHREVDALVDQIRADARGLLVSGRVQAGSWPRYYYQHGVRRGRVDMEAVASELLGDVRTRFIANVQQTDADAGEILKKLNGEYPPAVVSRVVTSLKDRNRVTRRGERFEWLG